MRGRTDNGSCLAVLASAALLCAAGHAQAQVRSPLRVLVSNGVKAALLAVTPRCEAASSASVLVVYGTSSSLRALATSEGAFDAAIMTVETLDALSAAGAVQSASRRQMARTRIGVGVRDGAPVPDVRTADAVRTLLLKAGSVSYATEGASRPFLVRMFERLGVVEHVAAKTHAEPSSVGATARVVEGRTEIVLTLVSEIVPVAGLRLAGFLPEEFQGQVTFAAGVGARSTRAHDAARFLACVTAPDTEAAYTSVGLKQVRP